MTNVTVRNRLPMLPQIFEIDGNATEIEPIHVKSPC